MKKMFVVLLFTVILIIVLPSPVYAYNEDEKNIASEAGVDEISFSEVLTETEKNGDDHINFFDKIFVIIKSSFNNILKNALTSFYSILCVVVLSSIFSTLKQTSINAALSTAFDFISLLALTGIVFFTLNSAFKFAADVLTRLHMFMTALLPVSASLLTMSGNVTAGAASSSSLLFFLTVVQGIADKLLFPLLQIGFAITLAGSLPGTINLQSLTTLVKNSLTTLMAFVFSIFGVVMYFQTTIAAASDNYIFRSVRFASGVFVPIIGSMVGDAARTVMASVDTVKSSVGAMGVITVLSMVLPVIIYIIMYKAVILINAIISRMLGCDRESKLLYDVNSLMSILMSLMIGVSVIFIIAIAMFIKTGVSI
ncbi:stage III sporulation protein AE [Eubacteriales bacterium OttesenSCG-928-G02]|nr:stage III sporulation protein AE [Eubacteriales bacterium OttesenSCG-928-G02]